MVENIENFLGKVELKGKSHGNTRKKVEVNTDIPVVEQTLHVIIEKHIPMLTVVNGSVPEEHNEETYLLQLRKLPQLKLLSWTLLHHHATLLLIQERCSIFKK